MGGVAAEEETSVAWAAIYGGQEELGKMILKYRFSGQAKVTHPVTLRHSREITLEFLFKMQIPGHHVRQPDTAL